METATKEQKATIIEDKPQGNRSFWGSFVNFLACGGFLVVLIVIVGIALLISVLFK